MMKVALFGRAKEIQGSDYVLVESPLPKTVGELRRRLIEHHPRLASLVEKSALAVDCEFAGDDVPISESMELALLPPVSGG
jgi:molybdopterin converting factor small subunit